jgi:DNA-directed RNA polymerase specialized sigma24 family protein
MLQRAAQGNVDALGSLLRARKERVYQLVTTLVMGPPRPSTAALEDRRRPASGEFALSPTHDGDGAAQLPWLANWRLLDELQAALGALPYAERQALILADVEGLASDQVAWLLNLDEAEIVGRLERARRLLQTQLLSSPQTCQSA